MAKTKQAVNADKITSVVAREDNGNIQITFSIPFSLIQKAQEDTLGEMANDVEIPGFRKGKAPIAKVREKVSENKLIEHSLGHLLPKALGEAIDAHKLKLAVYPRFELVSAKENEVWQVKGVSCELPQVDLGNYKEIVRGIKGSPDKSKEPSREEKETQVLKALLENIKVKIPQILIQEESDSRLSGLLSRIEKLGLALENYLTSIGKNAEELRAEYAKQAAEAISMDLILTKIAQAENLMPTPKEVDEAYSVSQASASANAQKESPESQKRMIESILMRRKALDFLAGLN